MTWRDRRMLLITSMFWILLLEGCATAPTESSVDSYGFLRPPSVEQSKAALEGLPFDEFADTATLLLQMHSPDDLVSMDPTSEIDLLCDRWPDYSHDAFLNYQLTIDLILEQLGQFSVSDLDSGQRITRAVLLDTLNDESIGRLLHAAPVFSADESSPHIWTIRFLTRQHPMATVAHVDNYLLLMEGLADLIDQCIEQEQIKVDAGCPTSWFVLEPIVVSVSSASLGSADEHVLVLCLEEKLPSISEMDEQARNAALAQAKKLVRRSIQPAYKRLLTSIEEWIREAPRSMGMDICPSGVDIYRESLEQVTWLTPEDIHQLANEQIEKAKQALRNMASECGLPSDLLLWQVVNALYEDWQIWDADAGLEEYKRLIKEAEARCQDLFTTMPESELVVQLLPFSTTEHGGAASYYSNGLGEQPEPCVAIGYSESWGMIEVSRGLAYHEAYPGHHLQFSWADQLDLPLARQLYHNKAYTEGWATYAETLAWEQGWLQNDVYARASYHYGQLQDAAFAVMDTGLNALGWSRQDAVNFVRRLLGGPVIGFPMPEMISARPGAYLPYWLGHYTFISLRDRAKDALGDQFRIAEFHDAVLSQGVLPLRILEVYVQRYIDGNVDVI